MPEIASRLRGMLPTLCPLALAPLAALGLLFLLSGCGGQAPAPLTVRAVEVQRLSPPAALLAPACPEAEPPPAAILTAADWEGAAMDWIEALTARVACLEGALDGIRAWAKE